MEPQRTMYYTVLLFHLQPYYSNEYHIIKTFVLKKHIMSVMLLFGNYNIEQSMKDNPQTNCNHVQKQKGYFLI